MSDRPCNLRVYRRYVREYGDRMSTRVNEHGWTEVLRDGEPIGHSFLSLPDEANCGAYGGECEC